MSISIAETSVTITLDEPRKLLFDANSMCAFEEATGKFFLDTVAHLYDAMRPMLLKSAKVDDDKVRITGEEALQIIRKVSIVELSALLWSCMHEYEGDEPTWPLSLNQVKRMLKPSDVPRVFMAFLKGQLANSPSLQELGESPALSKQTPRADDGAAPSGVASGGETSLKLLEGAFD